MKKEVYQEAVMEIVVFTDVDDICCTLSVVPGEPGGDGEDFPGISRQGNWKLD